MSDNVAHDLRTPLTRMRGRLEKAYHAKRVAEVDQSLIGDTIADLDAVLRIFSSITRIAQIETQARTDAFRSVNLVEIASEVVELYDAAADQDGTRLTVTGDREVVVTGDRDLIFDAIANLVDNAVKHGRPGGQVVVANETIDGRPVISISDDGRGIPAHEHEQVFKRFYRLEHSRYTPGNGLGLSLVAAVARLHGAQIEMLDNAPGLTFRLSVRRAGRLVADSWATRPMTIPGQLRLISAHPRQLEKKRYAMQPALTVKQLRSELAGPFELSLDSGACAAITGASGSGKSLFLRMIADLDPNEGEVWLNQQARAAMPAPAWRKQVTYVAAESGWWAEIVIQHFPLGRRDEIATLASPLGVRAELLDAPVAQLSTGEKQRLALVRALLPAPPVLLLDEPTGRWMKSVVRVGGAASAANGNRHIHIAGHARSEPGRAAGRSALSHGGETAGSAMNPILLTPLDISIAAAWYARCGALDPAETAAASANRHRRGQNGGATGRDRLCAALHLFAEQPGSHIGTRSGRGAGCRPRGGDPAGDPVQGTLHPGDRICQRRLCHLRHGGPCVDDGDPAAALVRSALCDPARRHHSRQRPRIPRAYRWTACWGRSSASGRRSRHGSRSAEPIAKRSRRWCATPSGAASCRSSIRCRPRGS